VRAASISTASAGVFFAVLAVELREELAALAVGEAGEVLLAPGIIPSSRRSGL